jgi:hypothetical protein
MSNKKKSILQTSDSEGETSDDEINPSPVGVTEPVSATVAPTTIETLTLPTKTKPEAPSAKARAPVYTCEHCGKTYTRSHGLKKHIDENRCSVNVKNLTEKLNELKAYEQQYGRKLENKKRADKKREDKLKAKGGAISHASSPTTSVKAIAKPPDVQFSAPRRVAKKKPVHVEVEESASESDESCYESESDEEPPVPPPKMRRSTNRPNLAEHNVCF